MEFCCWVIIDKVDDFVYERWINVMCQVQNPLSFIHGIILGEMAGSQHRFSQEDAAFSAVERLENLRNPLESL
ncbi:hypothetical protein WJ21_16895 [Burkholderia vietnamiensis]|nr:hypothetical protein WJ02_21335 [Burkholderia vietnamiensis]KVF97044.1 hypothetical protein WJ21_16895 [Burkholderia vietnamiensis]